MQTIVSAAWLQAHLGDPNIRILDASYHLPTAGRDPELEFVAQHIPGALRFDIQAISDHSNALPHMLPCADEFVRAVGALGVTDETQVVVYDSLGLFSAARAWWMFRHFGHGRVAVLDGGLPAWLGAGGGVESGAPDPVAESSSLTDRGASDSVVDAEWLLAHLHDPSVLILDARARGRFSGTDPEPRPGMRSGHIPGCCNLPFVDCLDPQTRCLKPASALRRQFAEAGLLNQEVVVSCGSGVTACVLALAMAVCELPPPRLYDGSWSDWGSRDDLPIETASS